VAEVEAKETVSPHSLVTLAGLEKTGRLSLEAVSDAPYHCTHCGACTEACLHKNEVTLVLSLARQRLLTARQAPSAIREVRDSFAAAGNAYGRSLREPLAELAKKAGFEVDLASGTRSGSTLYLPGCAAIHEAPDVVVAWFEAILVRGFAEVTVSEASAACCGLPLLWAGDLDGFHDHAERFAERVAGASAVVAHDPACAHAMRHWYEVVGVPLAPEIQHLSELASARLGLTQAQPGEALDEAEAPLETRRTLAYLDACHLTRGLRLVRSPRRLVTRTAGVPRELPGGVGFEADCCGASGLLPSTEPKTAVAMGEAKLAAFRETGAEVLVTASPRCLAHLRKVDPSAEIVDIAHLIARFGA
jgi:Fe-S oxidoreductase